MDTPSILDIIGNKTRRRILTLIAEEPQYVSQIAKRLDVTQPAVVRHIQILKERGIIESYSVKNPRGAARKYYKIIPSIDLEIALNPNTFEVMERPRQAECQKYHEKVELVEELTERINAAGTIDLKASIAVELIADVNELLSCNDFNESEIQCIRCRKYASLKESIAQVILDVSKGNIRSVFNKMNKIINNLFRIQQY